MKCKLTNPDGKTRNDSQWGEGITRSATGNNPSLCSDGWIHYYEDPIIAVLINSRHADFKDPILWECETSGMELHEPLKSGCKTLTTIRRLPLPEVTPAQKVGFGILCAKQVCKNEKFAIWADNWLSGKDRSKTAASAAASAAATDAACAVIDAVSAAYYAASAAAYYAAASAAYYAASAAAAAAAYYAASAAADAAYAVIDAASAAYYAASAAAYDVTIDFVVLAHQCLEIKE